MENKEVIAAETQSEIAEIMNEIKSLQGDVQPSSKESVEPAPQEKTTEVQEPLSEVKPEAKVESESEAPAPVASPSPEPKEEPVAQAETPAQSEPPKAESPIETGPPKAEEPAASPEPQGAEESAAEESNPAPSSETEAQKPEEAQEEEEDDLLAGFRAAAEEVSLEDTVGHMKEEAPSGKGLLEQAVAEVQGAVDLALDEVEKEMEASKIVPLKKESSEPKESTGQGDLSLSLSSKMTLKIQFEGIESEVLIRFQDDSFHLSLSDGTEFKVPTRRKSA